MTDEKSALTTPPGVPLPAKPPPSDAKRLGALESRMTAMELALRKAFGDRWLDEQARPRDGE
jgi:hypothetical protein